MEKYGLFQINKAVRTLIAINLLINAADGFLAPVFAIFVTQKIMPGQIKIVGLAIAIYWLVKSIIQIPLARSLDKIVGEGDDLKILITGAFILTIAPLLYIFAQTPFHLYLIQAIFALGAAFYVVPWFATFSRHLDKPKIDFEWAINSSAIGFGLVAVTALGGFMADELGFVSVFIASSIFNFIATLILIFLYKSFIKTNLFQNQK